MQTGKRQRRKEKVTRAVRPRGAQEGIAAAEGPRRSSPHVLRGADPGPPLRARGDEIIQLSYEGERLELDWGGGGSPGGVGLGSGGEGRR